MRYQTTWRFGTVLILLAIGSYGCSAASGRDDLFGFGGASGSSTHTVRTDDGGSILTYALQARQTEKEHGLVRFAGRCISACTLYLSLPATMTCIVPGAHFGFHRPIADSRDHVTTATNFMMRDYPAWVRAWIDANGGLTGTMKFMPYSYAAQHIPACEKSTRLGR